MSTVPALFRRLVDDAALFPPGNAPLERAVAEHRHHRAAEYEAFVGRFLCPASRVPAWVAALGASDVASGAGGRDGAFGPDGGDGGDGGDAVPAGGRLRLGIVADTGVAAALAARNAAAGVVVDAIEVPPGAAADARPVPDVAVFVELARGPGWLDGIARCAEGGLGAKLRTGGATPDAVPADAELAAFVTTCVAASVPFKCTAGLHAAVRGPTSHGFLNVLLATAAAVAGGDVAGAVAERDPDVLVAAAHALDAEAVRRTRAAFVAFGSCSVAEPLDDLARLGLLDIALPAALP